MLLVLTRKTVDKIVARVVEDTTPVLVQELRDHVSVVKAKWNEDTFQCTYAEEIVEAIGKELVRRNMASVVQQIIKEVK